MSQAFQQPPLYQHQQQPPYAQQAPPPAPYGQQAPLYAQQQQPHAHPYVLTYKGIFIPLHMLKQEYSNGIDIPGSMLRDECRRALDEHIQQLNAAMSAKADAQKLQPQTEGETSPSKTPASPSKTPASPSKTPASPSKTPASPSKVRLLDAGSASGFGGLQVPVVNGGGKSAVSKPIVMGGSGATAAQAMHAAMAVAMSGAAMPRPPVGFTPLMPLVVVTPCPHCNEAGHSAEQCGYWRTQMCQFFHSKSSQQCYQQEHCSYAHDPSERRQFCGRCNIVHLFGRHVLSEGEGVQCTGCHRNGHTVEYCRAKVNCAFCKRPGHDEARCFKKNRYCSECDVSDHDESKCFVLHGCKYCRTLEHRGSACPQRFCDACKSKLHWTADCPDRNLNCPHCNAKHANFDACSQYIFVRK